MISMKARVIFRIFSVVAISILLGFFSEADAQKHKHHYKHRNSPHHPYSKLPKWGFSISSTPKKSVVIKHAGAKYHFYSGVYYKHVGNKYKVVKAPIGLRIKKLPSERIVLKVRGKKYVYYYGTFYAQTTSSNEYIVVEPPLGARVNALPDGYKEVKRNGVMYCEFEGVLYSEVSSTGDKIWYEVIEVKS